MGTNKRPVSFELSEEMLKTLTQEYNPTTISIKVKERFAEENNWDKALAKTGAEWARRVIEMGEQYSDRTSELISQVIEQTNDYQVLLPQRFIEIAYLSLLDMQLLDVRQNYSKCLAFQIDNCAMRNVLEHELKDVHCQALCGEACKTIFAHAKLPADVGIDKSDFTCKLRISGN